MKLLCPSHFVAQLLSHYSPLEVSKHHVAAKTKSVRPATPFFSTLVENEVSPPNLFQLCDCLLEQDLAHYANPLDVLFFDLCHVTTTLY